MKRLAISLYALFFFTASCQVDQPVYEPGYGGFPEEVGKIFVTRCAVEGCHNTASRQAAAGLGLETWEQLFEGTRNNAAVIPYRPDHSFLMFFVNTYPDLGLSIAPTMPLNEAPLTREEVMLLHNWILAGAPNANGKVKFSGNPGRKKIYVVNQGCDNMAVIDGETQLIMRYIDIGAEQSIEAPHKCKVSPDGKYLYVCFLAGRYLQKFSTEDESLAGQVDIGNGSWNTFVVTADGKRAFVVDWASNGTIAVVDLDQMKLLTTYKGTGLLQWPHGSALKDDRTLYITAQTGNFLYKIDVTDVFQPDFQTVVLQPGESPTAIPRYDPHDLRFSPDKTEYAVTCQRSNEVRFFDSATDNLIATVKTGTFPQELEYSKNTDYLFVSCMEDQVNFPGKNGSVAVINYKTHSLVKHIHTGFQPHGLEPDDSKGWVYVANRNATVSGPAPHHTTACGGRNGYLTIIDMNTLELVPGFKAELSVDPYYIAVKE